MLLLHGTADPVVSFDQSLALAGALENSSVVHLLMLAARQSHGCWGVPGGICIQWLLFASERFFAWTFAHQT
ncbi:ICME [Symbiodinium natans]|uniref:ICME protein n=1 Tax=Symbiodinium natans TaxID=878477 RepID=A0A812MX40_9DINO|nr:ICME [Symbiodinium natans]